MPFFHSYSSNISVCTCRKLVLWLVSIRKMPLFHNGDNGMLTFFMGLSFFLFHSGKQIGHYECASSDEDEVFLR